MSMNMNLGRDEQQSFSDAPSELQSSHLSQASFYSDFGTTDTETSSWLRESSVYSSFSVDVPQRMETIADLRPHLDRLRARALEDSLSSQSERERVRRPFPTSRNSSFSSRTASSMRSSFGSCNVHEPSFRESFLSDGDDEVTLKQHCLTIPEHPCDIPTADTLPHQNECAKLEGGDVHQAISFASFDEFGLGDESFIDDWPARDAKVRFHANSQVSKGSDHRRDSIFTSGLPSSEQTNVAGVV
eukprot:TRINITY_DN38146_c0_g1_i1.p1 TRINITY_DN38146_c0_g1~~TRINITY_DN38146_c0_g1_i1.p1  ORF type:complete len:244 (-),score=37.80 TRINITY_DN38146_c0_g1_i1:121-852(-)